VYAFEIQQETGHLEEGVGRVVLFAIVDRGIVSTFTSILIP
jgi:hypothetical protein